MKTVRGGERTLPYIFFSNGCMYGLALVLEYYLKFVHLVGKEFTCIYIIE